MSRLYVSGILQRAPRQLREGVTILVGALHLHPKTTLLGH